MNKEHFLILLKINLKGIPMPILEDTLAYYKSVFDKEMALGKTEELISKELGTPHDIAKGIFATNHIKPTVQRPKFSKGDWIEFDTPTTHEYDTSTYLPHIDRASSPLRSFFVTVALIFFNLIFMLPSIITIFGLMLAFWMLSVCFIVSPVIAGVITVASLSAHALLQLSCSLILCGAGILFLFILLPLTKFFTKAILAYLKWNIRTIKGGYSS